MGLEGEERFLIQMRRQWLVSPFLVVLFLVILFLFRLQAEVPTRRSAYLEPMIELLGTNLLKVPSPFGGDQLSLVCALAGSVSRAMNVESE